MITEVSIENFKCFKNEEKFYFSKLNLLTGINGRGKSTLLQSLLLISQTFIKRKTPQQLELALNGEWVELGTFDDIKNDSNTGRIVSFHFISDDNDQNNVCLKFTDAEESERIAKLVNFFVNGEEKYIEKAATADITEENNDNTQQQSQNKYLLPLDSVKLVSQFYRLHYVAADRLGPIEYVKKNNNPDSLRVGIKGENLVNVLAYNENVKIENTICNGGLKEDIVEWLGYIFDGANIKVKGREEKEISILRILLNSQQNGRFYKPANVGFGYSYVLPIIATGLIAKSGDIFIVENPEAHLHPRAQSRLTEFFARLAANGVQIFIESHSEHILNALRINALNPNVKISNKDVSIYYFDESFKPEKLDIDGEGKIANWPNGFFDQQEIDLAQLFKYSR